MTFAHSALLHPCAAQQPGHPSGVIPPMPAPGQNLPTAVRSPDKWTRDGTRGPTDGRTGGSEEGGLGDVVAGGGASIRREFGQRGRTPLRVAVFVDQLRTNSLDEIRMLVHKPEHPAVLPF